MSVILLSIKPEYCKKIFDGTKKYEFRKHLAQNNVSKIIVYSTFPEMKVLGEVEVIPVWLWIWIGVIAVIKLGNVAWGFIRTKKFVSPHTVLNKITGLLLFLLPLTISLVDLTHTLPIVCSVATLAAIYEVYFTYSEKKYDT